MKLQVQTLLDNRYRITAFLSQGGFGYTYLAEDLFGKKVCIKELFISGRSTRGPKQEVITEDSSDFSFEHFSTRFWEEAKQLAAFDHPNIVKVKDFFKSNGSTYLVMEYIEGETLLAKKQKGELNDEQRIFAVMTQLLAAVETVHNAAMLHRDIKPENILIANDNRVVLIDFGSARDYEEAKTLTQSTILTPGYAPIEQYSNRAKRGAFTDIYALGATLYFLLTGQKPLPATDRYREQLPSPQQLNPAISTQLSSAVMMAMAMEPEDRFQSVADLKAALLLSGKNEEKTVVTEKRTLNEVLKPLKTTQIETHTEIAEKPVNKSRALLFGGIAVLIIILLAFLFLRPAGLEELSYCDCYKNLSDRIKGEKSDSLKILTYEKDSEECNKKKKESCKEQTELEKTIAAVKLAEAKRLKASDNDNYKDNITEPRNEKIDTKKRNDRESDNKSNEEVKTTPKINSNEKTEPSLDFSNFKGDNKSSGNIGTIGQGRGDVNDYKNGSEEGLCVKNCYCANSKWDIDVIYTEAWITVEINEDGSVYSARFAETGDVKNGRDYTSLNRDINAQKSATKNIILDCFRKRIYKSKEKKYRVTQKIALRKI